jgi:serine/threonine-protein kinase
LIRWLDRLDPQLIPGTQEAFGPFVSPDSRWIGFFQRGDLKKVAASGGSLMTVSPGLTTALDGSWADDDTIVFSRETGPLSRVSASGGRPEALMPPTTAQRFGDPSVLPGAGAVLFTATTGSEAPDEISVLNLKTGLAKTVLRGAVDPAYATTGHLLYRAGGNLFAAPFDPVRLDITGEPRRILDTYIGGAETGGGYAVSRSGTLAILPGDPRRTLVWVDRSGREAAIAAPARPYFVVRISPDGTRAAMLADDEVTNISVWDFSREVMTRLTIGATVGWVPVWTPDSRRIIYTANRTGAFNLYVRNADGSGIEERLTTSDHQQVPNSMLPDGTAVLGAQLDPSTGWDIFRLSLFPSRVETLVSTSSPEFAANISPNGRYFAHNSYDTGRSEIWIRRYPDAARERWQVSSGGGTAPVWARNGRELFYFAPDSAALMSVAIDASRPDLGVAKPTRLFETKYFGNPQSYFYAYDVSPDGQRFLFIKVPSSTNSILVLVNWAEDLRAHVATK